MVHISKPNIHLPHINLKGKSVQLVTLIALVVLAGLVTVGSLHHLQTIQNKKDAEAHSALVASQKAQAVEQAKLAKAAKVEAAYNALYVECTKGASVYANVLTPAQKLQVQRLKSTPNCGTAEPAL